jgi:hypothetical protein
MKNSNGTIGNRNQGLTVCSAVPQPTAPHEYVQYLNILADPSGRAKSGVGLWSFASWNYEFESRRGHGCLSLVSVVCCHTGVFALARSLVESSPTRVWCV